MTINVGTKRYSINRRKYTDSYLIVHASTRHTNFQLKSYITNKTSTYHVPLHINDLFFSGDAKDTLLTLAEEKAQYDIVFIDADKGGYLTYFKVSVFYFIIILHKFTFPVELTSRNL